LIDLKYRVDRLEASIQPDRKMVKMLDGKTEVNKR
jgi:hypothetical protein